MNRLFQTVIIAGALVVLSSFDLPEGWHRAGSKPDKYEMGVDKTISLDGEQSATIQSKEESINGFGTLMQCMDGGEYLGKRIRMSGYVKTEDVKGWAGLWLRVDKGKKSISFDNMQTSNRAIKETTSWTKYEIVLDVPECADGICFGALLSGTGKIWFDNLRFEEVDKSVPVTGRCEADACNRKSDPAINLDFEK